jgi:hypothetical protein
VSVKDVDRGYAKRVQAIVKAGAGPTVTYVGVLGANAEKEHKGSPGMTVSDLATIHEFGLGVPERSFLRAWFDSNRASIEVTLRAAHRQVLLGKLTPKRAGELIGLKFAGEVQKYIAEGHVQPPLSEQTVKKKGSSVPLVDTGQLRAAISWYTEVRLLKGL